MPQIQRPGGIQAIRGISSGDWFSPLQPIPSTAPGNLLPRQYQYTPGQNIIFTPRGEEPIGFEQLRGLAESYDLLRAVIETWKDLVVTQKLVIRSIQKPGETKAQQAKRESGDSVIGFLTDFFQSPDGEHDWPTWLRALLEDMGVIDAATLWVERSNKGKVVGFRPIDGATIVRYIDEQGFTPKPPNQAYAQVLYGQPAVPLTAGGLPVSQAEYEKVKKLAKYDEERNTHELALTSGDILYLMHNWRTWKLYGYSPVEQAIISINIALRRQIFTLDYYTTGNVPEGFYTMPPGVTIDGVKEFQDWFDSVMAGNLAKKRRIVFMPGDEKGSQKYVATKEPLLKNEMDDYLASFFCFLFGISRQALIKQMNRASAEQSSDSASEEGLRPTLLWVQNVVTRMIRVMGFTGYRADFESAREVDVLKQAQADALVVDKIITRNESREQRGLDPSNQPEANQLGVDSPTAGFIPLGSTPPGQSDDAGEEEPAQVDDADAPRKKKDSERPLDQSRPKTPQKGARKAVQKSLQKSLDSFRIDTTDDADVAIARSSFQQHIESFFAHQRDGVKQRVGLVTAAMTKGKLRKDDDRQRVEEAALDLEWYGLVYPAETAIYDAGVAGATKGLAQVNVSTTATIGKSQDLARAYAQDRAAEMVGMKWQDGELIENPTARWAISDTTRDDIRAAVEKAFSEETPIAELADKVAAAVGDASRAKMIAKTEVTRAQSKGILGSWLQTGTVLKAKWVLSSIHHCCDECDLNAAAGSVEVGKAYPSGATEPGAHPNCNCALVATEIRK